MVSEVIACTAADGADGGGEVMARLAAGVGDGLQEEPEGGPVGVEGDAGRVSDLEWLGRGAAALLRTQQLLHAVRHQALPALLVWGADAAPAAGRAGRQEDGEGAQRRGADAAPDAPGDHRHVWLAARALVAGARQQLSALLAQARALEARLQSPQPAQPHVDVWAAAAEGGPGALDVWQLQQEWGELENRVLLCLFTCLGPLLGLPDASSLRDAAAAATAEARAPAAPARAGSPHLLDAWQPLAHALLQLGGLAAAAPAGGDGDASGAAPPPAEAVGADGRLAPPAAPLPLDLEVLRPLLFVMDALSTLLLPPGAEGAPEPAFAAERRLCDDLRRSLLAAHLPPVEAGLRRGAAAARRLEAEAAHVLQRRGVGGRAARAPRIEPFTPQPTTSAGEGGGGRNVKGEALDELVPFTAFDPDLAGADEMLEDDLGGLDDDDDEDGGGGQGLGACGSDAGSDWLLGTSGGSGGAGGGGGGSGARAGLPDLVPFDGFDPDLPGAGVALDDSLGGGSGDDDDDGSESEGLGGDDISIGSDVSADLLEGSGDGGLTGAAEADAQAAGGELRRAAGALADARRGG
ncbi:hypothetical protein MNEG_15324 [Monoraphidium neglectum]|uniref:Uncharacterized protein n=1 Tax=Monoraphidium neglectum TaxID=145388 RepID=A0A0D2LLF6_9CHLO|nr:hypothetical protein MNEG_15324 [Monoraphidium neglectum]KIY92639.1 hypothetical protein MNEG_15324 [Monoraphidium neglectum]|eukprot:XP_013891659.1 hypothetical protein MNEG_15324 [Monoraphidium neglectum]